MRIIDSFLSAVMESAAMEPYNRNFLPRGLMKLEDLHCEAITDENFPEWRDTPDKLTYHLDVKNPKVTVIGWSTHYTGEKVAIAAIRDDDQEKWLVALDIFKKFRGYRLSHQIMNYLIRNYRINHLSVRPNNEVAIAVYQKHGFHIDQSAKNTDRNYFMIRR